MIDNELEFYQILREELIPALGCTEPISIAYAAAKAREILGEAPDHIHIYASGGLIKNIRCVTVPNTGGLIGIKASAIAGVVGGNSSKELQVLEDISPEDRIQMRLLLAQNITTVDLLETKLNLHFILKLGTNHQYVEVEVKNLHTNITKIVHNGTIIHEEEGSLRFYQGKMTNRDFMTIEGIVNFASNTDWQRLKKALHRQVEYNMAIAYEGLTNPYGVSIGNSILKHYPTVYGKMKGHAAAASEARMCGSDLPVITNSGSGNQGIAASIPIVVYAQEMNLSEEQLYRGLAISNLLTIYQKNYIGRLSAFCGAISACAGAGAAVTYLAGGTLEQVKMTVTNALADASGIVCDGAKASCASKIATGIEAACVSHFLAMENKSYQPFAGFLGEDADKTIQAVGRIASEGMKDTDRVILNIMLEK
ncbi:MAG: L-serine ammonia-lyase, iron-sulfur-dependent, subunit alpha [Candidatus Izemoplasmatales bacterium]|nr:L-serine ammonia-lyase, iron-sulfur-dependent, subunit alpha [bacterium]MDZ4196366.1 L-serine ammonia-lyase, iron-sulfur-dependent, subunit alpha [Candidatus Izemoplasmatales bacterium]